MTIQHGGRGGKSRNGLRPVHGSGNEVVSLTGIPLPDRRIASVRIQLK
jgi:hypothetical protein